MDLLHKNSDKLHTKFTSSTFQFLPNTWCNCRSLLFTLEFQFFSPFRPFFFFIFIAEVAYLWVNVCTFWRECRFNNWHFVKGTIKWKKRRNEMKPKSNLNWCHPICMELIWWSHKFEIVSFETRKNGKRISCFSLFDVQ